MRGHIPQPWYFLWGNKKRKERGQNKERIRERFLDVYIGRTATKTYEWRREKPGSNGKKGC